MNYDFKKHLIDSESNLKECLIRLNELGEDAILFVLNKSSRLIGTLTDGDVRRGFLKNLNISDKIDLFIQHDFKAIFKHNYTLEQVIEYRQKGYKVLPVLDSNNCVINIINFSHHKSYLPIDAVLMAGGKGKRLRPLTETTPKPLLVIGSKPIIEHNIDRLAQFGIDDFWISINYLGDQIENYFKDGTSKNIQIEYITEDKPLGTIGSISNVDNFKHEYVLISNSDILTNLDYEHFFLDFLKKDADLSIITIPYQVNVPYAVLELKEDQVTNFKEKPTYTYYSNGGIYLVKRSYLDLLSKNMFFDATDFMQLLISKGKKVISYPLMGYWLDIGKLDDFEKAKHDINQINF